MSVITNDVRVALCDVSFIDGDLLRLCFIVECGIARFLCAIRVFEVRASSSPPRLPLCQTLFFAASIAELAYGEKSCTQSLNQSPITELIWCSGNHSLRFQKFSEMLFVLYSKCFNCNRLCLFTHCCVSFAINTVFHYYTHTETTVLMAILKSTKHLHGNCWIVHFYKSNIPSQHQAKNVKKLKATMHACKVLKVTFLNCSSGRLNT